jgi:hypothetical protein
LLGRVDGLVGPEFAAEFVQSSQVGGAHLDVAVADLPGVVDEGRVDELLDVADLRGPLVDQPGGHDALRFAVDRGRPGPPVVGAAVSLDRPDADLMDIGDGPIAALIRREGGVAEEGDVPVGRRPTEVAARLALSRHDCIPCAVRGSRRNNGGSSSTARHRLPSCSEAISVEPEPANGSKTTSPRRELLLSVAAISATGFIVGCISLRAGRSKNNAVSWSLPPYQRDPRCRPRPGRPERQP